MENFYEEANLKLRPQRPTLYGCLKAKNDLEVILYLVKTINISSEPRPPPSLSRRPPMTLLVVIKPSASRQRNPKDLLAAAFCAVSTLVLVLALLLR